MLFVFVVVFVFVFPCVLFFDMFPLIFFPSEKSSLQHGAQPSMFSHVMRRSQCCQVCFLCFCDCPISVLLVSKS